MTSLVAFHGIFMAKIIPLLPRTVIPLSISPTWQNFEVGQRIERCKEMFSDFLRRYSESYRIIVSLMTLVVVLLR